MDYWINGRPVFLEAFDGTMNLWVGGVPSVFGEILTGDVSGDAISLSVVERMPRRIQLVDA
jgi:hypothetical protein